jgi:adenylate cyclase
VTSSDDLFAREQAIVATAQQWLEEESFSDDASGSFFTTLLSEYGKLLKTTRRMMRLSDRNEGELNRLAEQQRIAAEEISRKNQELEALSGKLSKYLSPQVYSSIFSGKQEVKLASRREKLTVFFSDITGFTEMTDRMESEDLTNLLNQYLTEMSSVALEYGATIDKFVGDAIMIFFGDPETRGVQEDALACVKMAIAMQNRIGEMQAEWQSEGIKDPLICRTGINTGYCTVGNFGSEDRMDYTIIGGAVNIASRLENEAGTGEIFISYETWAHVRHEIECKEVGAIQVKGVAYPVAVYRVLGLANEDIANKHIRAETQHFRLFVEPHQMTEEERGESHALLREAMEALELASADTAQRG